VGDEAVLKHQFPYAADPEGGSPLRAVFLEQLLGQLVEMIVFGLIVGGSGRARRALQAQKLGQGNLAGVL
jgi:hypothetical protein